MRRRSDETLVVPLQPGIATEVFRECLTEPFERLYGVRVETPARSERFLEEVERDIRSRSHGFDVVEWPPVLFAKAKGLGLCERLDYAAMPSTQDMEPRYLDADGMGVGVFVWGLSLAYDSAVLEVVPDSWEVLWDPEFAPRTALRNQLHASQLVPIACAVLGIPLGNLVDDQTFEAVWDKVAELFSAPRVWADSEGHIQELMSQGQVALAQQYVDVAQVQQDQGLSIRAAFPREGVIWGFRSWTIAAGCRRRELATAFIDFAQSTERQLALATRFYGHPVSRSARAHLSPELALRIYGWPMEDAQIEFPGTEWYLTREAELERRWAALLDHAPKLRRGESP